MAISLRGWVRSPSQEEWRPPQGAPTTQQLYQGAGSAGRRPDKRVARGWHKSGAQGCKVELLISDTASFVICLTSKITRLSASCWSKTIKFSGLKSSNMTKFRQNYFLSYSDPYKIRTCENHLKSIYLANVFNKHQKVPAHNGQQREEAHQHLRQEGSQVILRSRSQRNYGPGWKHRPEGWWALALSSWDWIY